MATFEIVDEEFIGAAVTIFDEQVIFLVDTGASVTAVDRRFQDRLGDRLEKSTVARTTTSTIVVPFYRSPKMTIVSGDSELDLIVPAIGVVDLQSMQAMSDRPIAGVIGMDFLKSYVLRLSFDEGYAALSRRPRDESGEMKHIDFGKSEFITPSIRLKVSDDQFRPFDLDTGGVNFELQLEANLFQKLRQKGRLVLDGESRGAGTGGLSATQGGTLDQVELGDSQIRNVDVLSANRNLLGLEFLARFETELDFPNRKAYFRAGKHLHERHRKNLTHFAVKVANNRLVVLGCRGIAQDAGIRAGDIVVKINERQARQITIAEFRRLQCEPDSDLKLQLERDGKAFDVSLHLQQPPNPFPESADEPKLFLEK